jgi:catechol 2,3-dioxygenase-like lactoylglutathione lyase family enzyme
MIDHLSVGVSSIDQAEKFYDSVLATIGCEPKAKMDGLLAYGRDRIEFLAMLPFDKNDSTAGNGVHIAFAAETNEQIDNFHKAVLENGGTCEGAPGTRPYPHAEVYATYVRDPFGNKLEALVGGFKG